MTEQSKIRNRKWAGLFAIALMLVVTGVAQAQQPNKVPRGRFLSLPSSGPGLALGPFRQGLREFGYIEGQNIASNIGGPMARPSGSRDSLPSWLA